MSLVSCDTFVVLPPLTSDGAVIFGKNSDRPQGEVQELVYEPSKQCSSGETVKCTYIEVQQVEKTYGVILSKPAWMWGCEMGANSVGVVIGNEAVWTKEQSSNDSIERLLGMDLVRLGLERSASADEGVDIITKLLETHGQGGPCSDSIPDFTYHNSFLLADSKEAWVLETAGRHWAAQRITSGCRNISNELSIETQIDKMSAGLLEHAKEKGFWNGEDEFNFAAAFSQSSGDIGKSCHRYTAGRDLLTKLSEANNFSVGSMFQVLRDTDSGICRAVSDSFPTTGSQVSLLTSEKPCCHWFTATPDPRFSVFKPFIFTPNVRISSYTKSPVIEDDPAQCVPRFSRIVDRRHVLYKLHETSTDNKVKTLLRDMEAGCLDEVRKFLQDFTPGQGLCEVDELLKDIVETEVKFYK